MEGSDETNGSATGGTRAVLELLLRPGQPPLADAGCGRQGRPEVPDSVRAAMQRLGHSHLPPGEEKRTIYLLRNRTSLIVADRTIRLNLQPRVSHETMPDADKKAPRTSEQQTTTRGLKPDPQHPWRHDNIGRLLLASVINWQDVLVRGLQDKGFRRFRASHMNLLRHIDLGGTRITEIAGRSRLSKQAVGQLVANCEAQKLVKTVSDPTDRRAKIVTFTNLGRNVIDAERDVMEDMDAELKSFLGVEDFAGLRRTLALLSEWTGPPGVDSRRPAPAKSRRKDDLDLPHPGA